ncbi:MAG: hypothetical protein NTU57_03125 [Candidatus Aenigmarchaeota archaeon]|nr:hypothetical protein [Candidatus Aenigmarchaeota archaeon]
MNGEIREIGGMNVVIDPSVIDADGKIGMYTTGTAATGRLIKNVRIRPKKVFISSHGDLEIQDQNLGTRKFRKLLNYLGQNTNGFSAYGTHDGGEMVCELPMEDNNTAKIRISLENLGKRRKGLPGLFGIKRTYGDVQVSSEKPYSAHINNNLTGKPLGEGGDWPGTGRSTTEIDPVLYISEHPEIRRRRETAHGIADNGYNAVGQYLPKPKRNVMGAVTNYDILSNGFRGI